MNITDRRLIIGLKAGLVQANTFVLDNLFKDQEHQDEIEEINEKHEKELQQKQNEVEELKKDLDRLKKDFDELKDCNINLNFSVNEFRALSVEKIREIEKLKSENTKVTNAIQARKREQTSKHSIFMKRLRNIIKKPAKTSDSDILEEIERIVTSKTEPLGLTNDNDGVYRVEVTLPDNIPPLLSQTYSPQDVSSTVAPQNEPKFVDAMCEPEIPSPVHKESNSEAPNKNGVECGHDSNGESITEEVIPSRPEVVDSCENTHTANAEIISEVDLPPVEQLLVHKTPCGKTVEEVLREVMGFVKPIHEIESLYKFYTEDEDMPKEQESNVKLETSETVIPNPSQSRKNMVSIFDPEAPSPVHDESSLETPNQNIMKCDHDLKTSIAVDIIPLEPRAGDGCKSKHTTKEENHLQVDLPSIERLFDHEKSDENTVRVLPEITKPMKPIHKIESLPKLHAEKEDMPKEQESNVELETLETVTSCKIQDTDTPSSVHDESSLETPYQNIMKCDHDLKTSITVDVIPLEPRADDGCESKHTTKEENHLQVDLPSVKRLFDHEKSGENTVRVVLPEITKPLKPIHEVESLPKLPAENEDMPKGQESDVELKTWHTVPNSSQSHKIENILAYLDELPNPYTGEWIGQHSQLVEFARQLKSERNHKYENNAVMKKNAYESAYVVVLLETTDSNRSSNGSLDIRDDILNEWIETDTLNEIDLENSKTEPQHCEVLEYTTASSPFRDDVLCLENTVQKIHVQMNSEQTDSVICWMNDEEQVEKESTVVTEERIVVDVKNEDSGDDSEELDLVIDEGSELEVKAEDGNVSFVTKEEETEPGNAMNESCSNEINPVMVFDNNGVPVVDHSRTTRYNLRQKSSLNYAVLGNVTQRKRTIGRTDSSPVRKSPKLDPNITTQPVTPVEEESLPVLESDRESECLSDKTIKENVCRPKFYLENKVQASQSTVPCEKTHFEQVWSTIRHLSIAEPQNSNPQGSNLVFCRENVLKTAWNFRGKKVWRREPRKQVVKLSEIQPLIRLYLQSPKPNTMAQLLAKLRHVNQTTICHELETALLTSKVANADSSLWNVSKNVDKDLSAGFVDVMKAHLKERMFAREFNTGSDGNGLSMISTIILESGFYANLCKNTGGVVDVVNLLYESLVQLKNRAHPIAYGVLKNWPSVLRDIVKYQPQKTLLVDMMLFCLAHHRMNYNVELYKVKEVQDLVFKHYGVKLGNKTAEEYACDTILNISNEHWTDTIVLLCKRQMFSWTYTHVIMKYMIPLLRIWRTDQVSEVLLLKVTQALCVVMRACPHDDSACSYNFDAIITTLSDILRNDKMSSRSLKETVCLALCELSNRNFSVCSQLLSSWTPHEQRVSLDTLTQLNTAMHHKWISSKWNSYIWPNTVPRVQSEKSKKSKKRKNKGKNQNDRDDVIAVGVTRSQALQQAAAALASQTLQPIDVRHSDHNSMRNERTKKKIKK